MTTDEVKALHMGANVEFPNGRRMTVKAIDSSQKRITLYAVEPRAGEVGPVSSSGGMMLNFIIAAGGRDVMPIPPGPSAAMEQEETVTTTVVCGFAELRQAVLAE